MHSALLLCGKAACPSAACYQITDGMMEKGLRYVLAALIDTPITLIPYYWKSNRRSTFFLLFSQRQVNQSRDDEASMLLTNVMNLQRESSPEPTAQFQGALL